MKEVMTLSRNRLSLVNCFRVNFKRSFKINKSLNDECNGVSLIITERGLRHPSQPVILVELNGEI
jgi:hypothetical protein